MNSSSAASKGPQGFWVEPGHWPEELNKRKKWVTAAERTQIAETTMAYEQATTESERHDAGWKCSELYDTLREEYSTKGSEQKVNSSKRGSWCCLS